MKLMGIDYEQTALATTDQRDEIAKFNPLVRVPALVLDDGEILIDSSAIVDHLNEAAAPDQRRIPAESNLAPLGRQRPLSGARRRPLGLVGRNR